MMKKRWAQRNKKMRQAQIKWAAGNDYAEVNLLSTDRYKLLPKRWKPPT